MRLFLFPAIAVLLSSGATSAVAGTCTSSLPDKPLAAWEKPASALKLLVPYGAGGGSGQLARAMAAAVTEHSGVAVDVEYIPGGSGRKGLDAFLKVPNDGLTILQHVDDAASAHALNDQRPDPASDLVPLMTAQVTFSQIYLAADENRFGDWAGLVAHAKATGGVLRIANVSRKGSMERLNLRLIADHYGLRIDPMAFPTGRGKPDPDGKNTVHALLEQPGDVRDFLESGKFRPILTLLPKRAAAFPKTPSLSDVGLNFRPLMRYRSYFAKRGTAKPRLGWLKWALAKAYCQPSFRDFNARKYMDSKDSFRDADGTADLINETVATYRKVQKTLGIKPE